MKIAVCFAALSLAITLQPSVLRAQDTEAAVGPVPAGSVKVVRHRVTVASNPSLGYDNDQIDHILSEMTQIANKSWFPWDASCSPIEFVRNGDVILSNDIPSSGEHDTIIAKAKQVAPTANAVIVLKLDCGLVQGAAGCGQVGHEPEVVIPYPGYEGVLWLHERGHNMGLDHAPGEGADENTQPEDVAKRIMFWRLGTRHFGKTSGECKTMSKVGKFASVVTVNGSPAIFAAATAAAELDTKYGLTVAAYRVIGPPWVDAKEPTALIDSLSDDDLASIRNMLKGPVNETWPNAFKVLARRGNASDVQLFERAIKAPVSALPENPSKEQRDQFRSLLRAKLAAPDSLGDLAKKTQDTSVVDVITEATKINKVGAGTNPGIANEVASQAVGGLAKSNNPYAQKSLDQILNAQSSGSADTNPIVSGEPVAKLSKPQIDRYINMQRDGGVKFQ